MMRKGVYSATIALTALVIAVAVIASTSQRLSAQGGSIYPNATIEVKGHWQNARYVLDKAASDAIADSVLANGCDYIEDDVKTTMRGYFTTALREMWQNECALDEFDLAGPSSNVQTNVTISCTKYFGERFSASYEKQATFKKEVETTTHSPCVFKVIDLQSGLEEVS